MQLVLTDIDLDGIMLSVRDTEHLPAPGGKPTPWSDPPQPLTQLITTDQRLWAALVGAALSLTDPESNAGSVVLAISPGPVSDPIRTVEYRLTREPC